MKTQIKQIIATVLLAVLCEAAITFCFFYALINVFPEIAIERYYLGTYGIVVYVFLLTLCGFLITLKSTNRIFILCSIGIPSVIVLTILVYAVKVPDFIRIPVFNQYQEYNESIRYGTIFFLAFPPSCAFVFTFAYLSTYIRDKYQKKVFDK